MGKGNPAADTAPLGLSAEQLRRSIAPLSVFLQGVGDGILVQDHTGTIVFINDAGARACGFPSAAAMRATPIAEVLDKFVLLDEAGQPFPIASLPAQRVLRGMTATETVLRTRVRDSHEERWSVVNATPVRDEQGAVAFAISIFQDITERKRAEATTRFFADASAILAESLDYETTLQRIAELAVPRVADWCSVDIADVEGVPHLLAIAHVDTEKVALAHEYRRRYPADPAARYGVAEAMRSGKSQLATAIPDAALVAGAHDADHLAMLRALGLASSMIVPLIARGRVLGTITFVSSSPTRRYGPPDLAFAETLAERAALAIDNARLYRDARAAEEQYRNLFAGVGDAVLVTDATGNYVDANPAMIELVGYSVAELRRLHVGDLTADADDDFAQTIHTLPDGAMRGEITLRRKDGSTLPVEGWITSVTAPTGTLFIGTWRDISARRRLEEERQRFIAMVAHELRNPLSSLIGYAELMRRRERYEAKAVETIITQGKRLERLTLDLRETMLVQAGVLALKRALIAPRPLIAAAIEQVQTTTDRPIAVDMPDDLPLAEWDADRVTQVLGNLLLNAIKYSGAEGAVRVRVEDTDAGVRITVADTGMGIPPDALPLIFEPFYRATNATDGSARGMGLGLPISKALVEAHGGEMSVESALGVGSAFTFTLPYHALPQ
ncbi:MAG: PAS domain S-box protein [Thermomicrobia bacterium]|nr:PAS domain S-box protein [Thermomicrobia bacterium]MCA1724543.1 PAS domain S-box protein [Thermomicrobia bacterium]